YARRPTLRKRGAWWPLGRNLMANPLFPQRHEPQHRVGDVGGQQGRRLARRVIRRRDLDHVEAHEVDPRQRPNERERLGGGGAADLGGARGRGVGRVDEVDVEAEERRAVSDAGPHAVRVVARAERAELVPWNELESELTGVIEVLPAVDRALHAGEDRA